MNPKNYILFNSSKEIIGFQSAFTWRQRLEINYSQYLLLKIHLERLI